MTDPLSLAAYRAYIMPMTNNQRVPPKPFRRYSLFALVEGEWRGTGDMDDYKTKKAAEAAARKERRRYGKKIAIVEITRTRIAIDG